jgi:cytochrome c-type biogenesis protein CcmH/NrfG
LEYYLKGDYYQAEHILEDLLRRNLRDLDARLMLATVLRRTDRVSEAVRQLDAMARFEGAGKWQCEMQRERRLLANRKVKKAA